MDSKQKPFFIFIAIITLQLVVMLYWANEKSNFFADELYSMCYASSYTGEGDKTPHATVGPEWTPKEWVNNGSLKKYMIVEEDEQIFRLPFFRAWKKLLTGKNYFGLLNIAESIAGYSFVSARPGIVLNMIIYIVAGIALVILMRKMKMNDRSQYLALAMFGFSSQGIGLVEFIRFYMLVIMYLLWQLILFYVVWNSDSFKKIIPAEFGILGLTYLSYRNSQLALIFFGAFSFCFAIALIMLKKWKPLISYVVMGLCGTAYVWVTTDYIKILLHPTDFLQSGNKAVTASLSIAAFSIDLTKANVLKCRKYFGAFFFENYFIVLMAIIALTMYSLWMRRRKKDETRLLCGLTECKIRLRNFKLSPESGFVCALLGAAVTYTLIIAMANLVTRRYFCIGFMLFYIAFWYILDRILTKCIRRELCSGWYIILTTAVALNALVPFKTREIPLAYIYEDDRSFISALEPYRNMDVVLAELNGMEINDCMNLMSENSYIYAVRLGDYSYDEEKFADEFVFWTRNDQDILPILNDLVERGYEVESLGKDHISQAYVCRINKRSANR